MKNSIPPYLGDTFEVLEQYQNFSNNSAKTLGSKIYPYRVAFYELGEKKPSDYLGYFSSKNAAMASGKLEIERVANMPIAKRNPGLDWAVRFTVCKLARRVEIGDTWA